MARIHETISDQFLRWEKRGRGWDVFPEPVYPEPPFQSFDGYKFPEAPVIDDGRKPTILSSFIKKLSRSLATPTPLQEQAVEDTDPEPRTLERSDLVELQLSLPNKLSVKPREFGQFISQLSFCQEPITFELLGTAERIHIQLVASVGDVSSVRRQLRAYFPDVVITDSEDNLQTAWRANSDAEAFVVEFGLGREFIYPLASPDSDPYTGLVAAVSELQPGEVGLFQVIFQPVENPWAQSILRTVNDAGGRPIFANAPELARLAQDKVSSPLFGAVVRLAVNAENLDRAIVIAQDIAGSLRVYGNINGNELIPLNNYGYPYESHAEDVVNRVCRRTGMLLNTEELIGFVHLPGASVRHPKLQQETSRTKAAPKKYQQSGLILGENLHAGQRINVALSEEDRTRHMHLIGASGTGKSTLLFNLIRQDIENGEGLALLDPHGDLVDRILGIIPPHRIHDVVLIDPSDESYSVGFNILSAHTDLEKTLLASDLVSVFQRLSTSWGDQMGSVLQNAILAFLESSRGGTLSDLRRFLIEPAFRNEFVTTVRDPDIVYYWQRAFQQLSGNKSIGPALTRLDTFLAPKPIRNMVSQKENKLDFGNIMDTGKIFLAKLSHGQIGKENSFLLGSLFVSKFQQMALSRQSQEASMRRPFWLYIDEFHNFITPSMAEILSGARKYRLGLILAHQELRQLQRDAEVASAVLSNCHTRICFRLGDDDAKKLAEGFSFFESEDLRNLNTGQAICRLERSDGDFNLTIPLPEDIDPGEAASTRLQVIQASRETYAKSKSEVEAELWRHLDLNSPKLKAEAKKVEVPETPTKKQDARPEPPTAIPPEPVPAPAIILDIPKAISKPEVIPEPVKTTKPRSMGRGGNEHKAIQYQLKQEAEQLGFKASIEKQTSDGLGSVDLFLERPDFTIACEISVTTTIEHEVAGIEKRIKAGLTNFAMVALSKDRLQQIENALVAKIGKIHAGHVRYFLPDEFIAFLKSLPPPPPPEPETKIHLGYKVKKTLAKTSNEDREQKEAAAVRAISDSVKRKKKS